MLNLKKVSNFWKSEVGSVKNIANFSEFRTENSSKTLSTTEIGFHSEHCRNLKLMILLMTSLKHILGGDAAEKLVSGKIGTDELQNCGLGGRNDIL